MVRCSGGDGDRFGPKQQSRWPIDWNVFILRSSVADVSVMAIHSSIATIKTLCGDDLKFGSLHDTLNHKAANHIFA